MAARDPPGSTVRRVHRMPFGTEVQPDGEARFRLWAPAVPAVTLCLEGTAERAMTPAGDGWFEATAAARAGARYRFRLPDGHLVPDPASRRQPDDVHGPSEVVDPAAFAWSDGDWRGRPFHEAVFYELHVGTFTPAGTFDGVATQLDRLARLGITAIELMPLAEAPGRWNWGYDGVYPFAPEARYGPPDALKRLVCAAHARGLMVFVDVVYNHFGPEGNYLRLYAPAFFTARHRTPWGDAIDFEGPQSRAVRDFVLHNALYWLEEFHMDGLRLDAVHAIHDTSAPDILEELAETVHSRYGADRHVHLVLENDRNEARLLARRSGGDLPRWYAAQWNDDAHHASHVLLTGERRGYYADYADEPAARLGRALAEGFVYQGEPSPFRGGAARGEPSVHLPPTAFVAFLQNHDQIGNRALGDRLAGLVPPRALRAAVAVLLLAPSPPLLFMGEEWAATTPFPFFSDLGPALAPLVREGRQRELAHDPAAREAPDPTAEETFAAAVLRPADARTARARRWTRLVRELLAVRRRDLVPRLRGSGRGRFEALGAHAVTLGWQLGDGTTLGLVANLGARAVRTAPPAGRALWSSAPAVLQRLAGGVLPGYAVAAFLEAAPGDTT
jgi:maltooligosyltrehalose trehalohydrolase